MAQKPAMHGRDHCPSGSDPIPTSCFPSGVAEWYRAESTTNLGTTWTDLDWSSPNEQGHDAGAAPPTFAINGASNLVIAKSGLYSIEIGVQSLSVTAGVNVVLFNDLRRIAGARPWSFRSTSGDPSVIAVPVTEFTLDVAPDTPAMQPDPHINTHFVLLPSAITSNGACEIRYQSYVEEDGVGVAHSEPTFYVFITRHGEAFEA